MAVPASSISGRHVDGLSLACLTSSAGASCIVDSQSWQGADMIYNSDGSLADEQPLTQMYDNATLCDECFTDIMKARLNSPYASSSSFNTYLAAELVSILEWCGEDSNITVSEPTSYTSASITATATSSTTVSTCTGQSLSPAKVKQRQLLSKASADTNITQQCENLSTEYNVPTGALLIATGNSDCNITTSTCLPPACELKQIGETDSTCTSLAAQLEVAGGSVSTIQLLSWNPTIIGTCDDLQLGQYVCITPPGGAWVPVIANITNGTAEDNGGITQSYS
ncbi:hypothetical protein NHQ30_000622 [Ciborinia camelliae]|nr:hypothetical protein NHQ30_000622 [Ciborinia camelliae]